MVDSKLYEGSVKDVLGPLSLAEGNAVIFQYTDAYSVFDWGRMPDLLPKKGEALAVLAAEWFERLERPESWREFSKSPEALGLRKGSRFGIAFNEYGERLQAEGLRTHYLGVLPADSDSSTPIKLSQIQKPAQKLVVRQVSVVKPELSTVFGQIVANYTSTRLSPLPRLVPVEVVFRFSVPPGSSLIERMKQDPEYLSSRGFPDESVQPGQKWEFPILELFTKLEPSDRPLTLSEGLAISGLSAAQLQDMLFKTAWVAGFLKSSCAKSGLELADGKLEWGMNEKGECFLVDAVGPDELRLLYKGVQLSKEFLRTHYRSSRWYESLAKAKKLATAQGVSDWKKFAAGMPIPLPPKTAEIATHLYPALTNRLTGKTWFPDAWDLERVVDGLRQVELDREVAL